MKDKTKILLLILLLISIIFLYIPSSDSAFTLELRSIKLLTAVLVGVAVSVSSFSFQTITNNNIITPGILGFDSLFLLIQTSLMFASSRLLEGIDLLIVCTATMLFISLFIFRYIFLNHNIFKALLLGTILSILFRSICSVLYTIMDPNAFDTMQSVMFTNFNSIDTPILPACILMVLAASLSIFSLHRELDVISVGESISKSLGVDREEIIIYVIIMISVLVSVSTSLVGPIVFIGLFVSNLTRIMFNTYKHKFLLPASILIGVNLLLGGVYLNDLVFTDTNLPVVIDGLGALYFIYLCVTRRSKIL